MEWITYEKRGLFWGFAGVQSDGHLSSELTSEVEVDFAANELKAQIDIASKRMKMALQGHTSLFRDKNV